MNDKDKIIDDINQISNKESKDSSDEVTEAAVVATPYSLFYSFFLIPLMIVIFGSAFYLLFYKITEEPNDINLLLNKLEVGSQKDKINASLALNRLFFEDQSAYDSSYRYRIIEIHRSSQTDKYSDPVQRLHTIMVMGNSGDKGFGDILIDELSSKDSEFRIKAIESLGKLRYLKAAESIKTFLKKDNLFLEKLAAAGALGSIGNINAIESLVELIESWPEGRLTSDEPNLIWEAALALLKLDYSDQTTQDIINGLLNREYLKTVPIINLDENKTVAENPEFDNTILYIVLGLLMLILIIKVKNKNMLIGIIVSVAVIIGGIVFLLDGDTSIDDRKGLTDSQINTVIEKTLLIIDSVIEKNKDLKRTSTFLVKDFEESIFKLSNSDPILETRDLAKKIYKDYK